MTTFNKLPYLKIVVGELIKNRQDDEEIIIVDGGSTDGSAEWLQELHADNKIQKFSSAKDFGESHGNNRAILLSEGKLLKVLTDDDVYNFEGIRECKNYMLQHEEIDILGADGYDNYKVKELVMVSHIPHFEKWLSRKIPFSFYGPGLMFRRSSIPLLGLYNCAVRFSDSEFIHRATSLPVKIAWFKKPLFVHLINSESNTFKFLRRKKLEIEMHELYTRIATGESAINLFTRRKYNRIKQSVYNLLFQPSSKSKKSDYETHDFKALYYLHYQYLMENFNNYKDENPFIYLKPSVIKN